MLNKSYKDKISIIFLYSLSTLTLLFSLWSFIDLATVYIDLAWASAAGGERFFNYPSMRWDLATLIVSFIVFLLVSLCLAKVEGLNKDESIPIKKLFSYFIFFIVSFVIIYQMTMFVYYFIGNELSIPFSLKTFISCAIILFVGYYYFLGLNPSELPIRIISGIAILAVLIVVGYGIYKIKTHEMFPRVFPSAPGITSFDPVTIPVKKLTMPTTSFPYCAGRSLKATKEENEVIQKLVAHFMSKNNCEIGSNCLLKWEDENTVNFHTAWKSCSYGMGGTFRCNNRDNNFCCSYEGQGERVCFN